MSPFQGDLAVDFRLISLPTSHGLRNNYFKKLLQNYKNNYFLTHAILIKFIQTIKQSKLFRFFQSYDKGKKMQIFNFINYGVFHVFHVNRSVIIFLLHRKFFYSVKIC